MPRRAPIHQPAPRAEQTRETSAKRGYGYAWQQARETFLAEHPLCVHCEAKGIVKASSVVDHITPHRGNKQLFWDPNNWQALCPTCHGIKTAAGA